MDAADACPVCHHPVDRSEACGCGLWWVRQRDDAERVAGSGGPTAPVSLVFRRSPPGAGAIGCGLFAFGFGLLGVLASLDTLYRAPADPCGWAGILCALPAGGLVVWVAVAQLAYAFLAARRPARVDIAGDGLRIRTWRTWGDLDDHLRWTDATLPAGDFRGVSLCRSQAPDAFHVFLDHVCGLSVYAGFTGPHAQAEAHAAALVVGLAGAATPDPVG
jgi:hypothetical protein